MGKSFHQKECCEALYQNARFVCCNLHASILIPSNTNRNLVWCFPCQLTINICEKIFIYELFKRSIWHKLIDQSSIRIFKAKAHKSDDVNMRGSTNACNLSKLSRPQNHHLLTSPCIHHHNPLAPIYFWKCWSISLYLNNCIF